MTDMLLEVGAAICSPTEVYDEPVWILFTNGVIQDMGKGVYPGDKSGLEVVRRPRGLAIPGLVNTHGHAAMTLLRGAGDDLPLMRWLTEFVFPMEERLTSEAVYWGTMLACWEMIRSGTTCFADMYMFMHDAARAVAESGLRGQLSWGLDGTTAPKAQRGIENSRRFAAAWNGKAGGRIQVSLGPHAPYTCPPGFPHRDR